MSVEWWCDDGSWDGSLIGDFALPLAGDEQIDDLKDDWTWPKTPLLFHPTADLPLSFFITLFLDASEHMLASWSMAP